MAKANPYRSTYSSVRRIEKTCPICFGELSLNAQWINAVGDGDIAFNYEGNNFAAIPESPHILQVCARNG